MTQVTKIINGVDNKHHDYDYTQHLIHLSMNVGGVGYASKTALTEFDFDTTNSVIKPGIAFVSCVRNSSQPIPNMKFMSVFYSDADVSVVVGPNRKYYIEIDQNKINDPSLIDDPSGSNDYYLGKGIGEIKSGTARPIHPNYLKLWSTDGSGVRVDERVRFMVNGRNVDLSDIENTNLDLNGYAGVITASTITATNIYATLLSVTGTANLPSGATFGGLTLTQILQINMATEIMRGLTKYLSFGDGSDGDVTLGAGTITLSRDMYYNNLVIPSGATLNPNGYRVFVRYAISGTGSIIRNGNNGTAGANASYSGFGVGGAALNQGSLNADLGGGNGGVGQNNADGTPGLPGTSANPTLSNLNGSNGGTGGYRIGYPNTNPGGLGGTSTRSDIYNKVYDYKIMHMATSNGYTAQNCKSSGSAGGGGGGSTGGGDAAGCGGGGGGNGGIIWIACHTFSFTGSIQSKGGNGGAGGNGGGGFVYQTSGGGGGAGGNGGCLLRICSVIQNEATINLAGGTGGAKGLKSPGSSQWTDGGDGQNGSAGQNITIMTTP